MGKEEQGCCLLVDEKRGASKEMQTCGLRLAVHVLALKQMPPFKSQPFQLLPCDLGGIQPF